LPIEALHPTIDRVTRAIEFNGNFRSGLSYVQQGLEPEFFVGGPRPRKRSRVRHVDYSGPASFISVDGVATRAGAGAREGSGLRAASATRLNLVSQAASKP
jgi:hypothetical protein